MTGLEPLQVLIYPFLDMGSPLLCDCLKITREPSNPVTFRDIGSGGKFFPAFAQGIEHSFPFHRIGAGLSRKVELHFCIQGINWLIGVKILSF